MDLERVTGFVQATVEGQVVVPRMKVADSFGLRGMGLMGKASVPEAYGAGLFFPKCRSLHTCFMRFPLTILFLDADGQVLDIRKEVAPWRMIKGPKGACHCAETVFEIGQEALGWELVWEPQA